MKKVNLLIFISLGMFGSLMANETISKSQITAVKVMTDEFVKVQSSELTPAVVEELIKQYPTSKLGGVYKNAKGEFKLIMILKSGTRRTVYIDQYGNWLKKK